VFDFVVRHSAMLLVSVVIWINKAGIISEPLRLGNVNPIARVFFAQG